MTSPIRLARAARPVKMKMMYPMTCPALSIVEPSTMTKSPKPTVVKVTLEK